MELEKFVVDYPKSASVVALSYCQDIAGIQTGTAEGGRGRGITLIERAGGPPAMTGIGMNGGHGDCRHHEAIAKLQQALTIATTTTSSYCSATRSGASVLSIVQGKHGRLVHINTMVFFSFSRLSDSVTLSKLGRSGMAVTRKSFGPHQQHKDLTPTDTV